MILDIENPTPFVRFLRAFLDGAPVRLCEYVDTARGLVRVVKGEEIGPGEYRVVLDENWRPVREERTGRVLVALSLDAPEDVRERFAATCRAEGLPVLFFQPG